MGNSSIFIRPQHPTERQHAFPMLFSLLLLFLRSIGERLSDRTKQINPVSQTVNKILFCVHNAGHGPLRHHRAVSSVQLTDVALFHGETKTLASALYFVQIKSSPSHPRMNYFLLRGLLPIAESKALLGRVVHCRLST